MEYKWNVNIRRKSQGKGSGGSWNNIGVIVHHIQVIIASWVQRRVVWPLSMSISAKHQYCIKFRLLWTMFRGQFIRSVIWNHPIFFYWLGTLWTAQNHVNVTYEPKQLSWISCNERVTWYRSWHMGTTLGTTSPLPFHTWSQSSPSQYTRLWVTSLAVWLHHWSMRPDGTIWPKNLRRDLVGSLLTSRERLDESSTLIIRTYPKFYCLSHFSLIGGYI